MPILYCSKMLLKYETEEEKAISELKEKQAEIVGYLKNYEVALEKRTSTFQVLKDAERNDEPAQSLKLKQDAYTEAKKESRSCAEVLTSKINEIDGASKKDVKDKMGDEG